MNVLLVGGESAGIQLLRALAQRTHRIVAVMASQSKYSGGMNGLWDAARELGYPTWPANLVRDPNFADRIRAEKVDILINIHSLFIIHPKVLEAPRIGSFNLHPGPLPRYAGLNVMSWALYRGERTHGVTLHKMQAGIDTGPIVYETVFDIQENDAALSLTAKCVREGLPLILRLLETAAVDPSAIPQVPQDLSQREYFGREVPENGRLSWSCPAREIINFVRACDYFPFRSPWGFPRAMLNGREIGAAKAALTGLVCATAPGTVGERIGSSVHVASTDEWIAISKLIIEGRYLDAVDVLKLGDRLEDGR